MIIVGLGNPGSEYENTRHNIGFMFVDACSSHFNLTFKLNKRCEAMVAKFNFNNETHYFVKPLTYMNNSGKAVKNILKYYEQDINSLLIIHDDMDLPLSKIRIRPSCSSGGHKGMESIIQMLKTQEVNRIKIGIDHNHNIQVIDYVLMKFSKSELEVLAPILMQAPKIVEDFITQGINYIMNHYNG